MAPFTSIRSSNYLHKIILNSSQKKLKLVSHIAWFSGEMWNNWFHDLENNLSRSTREWTQVANDVNNFKTSIIISNQTLLIIDSFQKINNPRMNHWFQTEDVLHAGTSFSKAIDFLERICDWFRLDWLKARFVDFSNDSQSVSLHRFVPSGLEIIFREQTSRWDKDGKFQKHV